MPKIVNLFVEKVFFQLHTAVVNGGILHACHPITGPGNNSQNIMGDICSSHKTIMPPKITHLKTPRNNLALRQPCTHSSHQIVQKTRVSRASRHILFLCWAVHRVVTTMRVGWKQAQNTRSGKTAENTSYEPHVSESQVPATSSFGPGLFRDIATPLLTFSNFTVSTSRHQS